MQVRICDRCKKEKAVASRIVMPVGRSRDAGGSMTDDCEYRDLCGNCSANILVRITTGRDATYELNQKIVSIIDEGGK